MIRDIMHKVYLSLGGNVGDVPAIFKRALSLMSVAGLQMIKISSLYESAAWGKGVSGMFYNQVVEACTSMCPTTLLQTLNAIEQKLGRRRIEGVVEDRTIDIDILFFDDLIIASNELVVPHPRMHLRKFVLEPLCELAPGFRHPVLGKTARRLLLETNDSLFVTRLGSGSAEQSTINE